MTLFCIAFSAASNARPLGIMLLPLECLGFLFAECFSGIQSFLLLLLTVSGGPGNSKPCAGDPVLAGYALFSCSSAAAKPCKVLSKSFCLIELDVVARERASFAILCSSFCSASNRH